MAISYKSILYDRERMFTIAVDQYGGGHLEGVLYQGDQRTGVCFSGYYGLAWQMEQHFYRLQYPRPVMDMRELRTVRSAAKLDEEIREENRREGGIATYTLRVTQRQNASWQGIITRDEGETYHFTSYLDFVSYLEGDLGGAGKARTEEPDREVCQRRLEKYLQIVMACPETMKILPDTLVCRFRKDGRSRTFMIRPMFYEHDTCQGTIYWKECRKQSSFRSFLELICMMGAIIWDESDWSEQEEAI